MHRPTNHMMDDYFADFMWNQRCKYLITFGINSPRVYIPFIGSCIKLKTPFTDVGFLG